MIICDRNDRDPSPPSPHPPLRVSVSDQVLPSVSFCAVVLFTLPQPGRTMLAHCTMQLHSCCCTIPHTISHPIVTAISVFPSFTAQVHRSTAIDSLRMRQLTLHYIQDRRQGIYVHCTGAPWDIALYAPLLTGSRHVHTDAGTAGGVRESSFSPCKKFKYGSCQLPLYVMMLLLLSCTGAGN
jgi:hypothetical protein